MYGSSKWNNIQLLKRIIQNCVFWCGKNIHLETNFTRYMITYVCETHMCVHVYVCLCVERRVWRIYIKLLMITLKDDDVGCGGVLGVGRDICFLFQVWKFFSHNFIKLIFNTFFSVFSFWDPNNANIDTFDVIQGPLNCSNLFLFAIPTEWFPFFYLSFSLPQS